MMYFFIRLALLWAALVFTGTAMARSGSPAEGDEPRAQGVSADFSSASKSGSGSASGKKIYRVRDENGNVVFTDEPPKGSDAEEVELNKGNSMSLKPAPEVSVPRRDEEPQPVSYDVKLVSPADEKTFQHPTEPIPIQFNVTPALKEGHEVQVLHNGKPLKKPQLEWPVRGEHSLRVQVVDAEGRVVSRSESHTIYVHRPSKQLP